MDYRHLTLQDRGEVVVAYLLQASILEQAMIDNIGTELSQVAFEASGTRKLLLNFQKVEFMSSAMLGKLMQLHKRCAKDKIKLKFCSIAPALMEVFKITNLTKLFDIKKDEAEAVAAFG